MLHWHTRGGVRGAGPETEIVGSLSIHLFPDSLPIPHHKEHGIERCLPLERGRKRNPSARPTVKKIRS